MIRLLVLATVTSGLKANFCTAVASMALRSIDFEVYGRVQGVFFRKSAFNVISEIIKADIIEKNCIMYVIDLVSQDKSLHLDFAEGQIYAEVLQYTKQQADKLDLKGWCRNTSRGTVEGQMEGSSEKVDAMMQWLKTTGSPSSKIDKADFKNGKDISEYSFSSFDIKRDD